MGENWQSRSLSSLLRWLVRLARFLPGWKVSVSCLMYFIYVSFKRNLKPVSERREACLVLAEGMPPSLLTLDNEFELGFIGSVCWSRLNFVPHWFIFLSSCWSRMNGLVYSRGCVLFSQSFPGEGKHLQASLLYHQRPQRSKGAEGW